jgi:signal transduction histidine kinase
LLRSRERTVVDLMAEARRLDEQREERARVAVQEERTRIARELHDVVAHAVSLMVLQTGAGRKALRSSPDRAEAMLTSAEETGRQALAEMKRLVGIMRAGAPALDPQPGLGQLETLVEGARASGKRVELQVTGGPAELAPGVDLAAFRIVQEALTNSIKHAGPAPARVLVDYRTDEVVVEVTDDGLPGALHWPPAEPGHGLAGMRERTNLYDGSLEVGPDPAGGLRVRATLPVEPS